MKQIASHLKVGALGEQLAAKWLNERGFLIKDKHYLKKWGEIDIVAEQAGRIHFVEVKSVSYGTREELGHNISRETLRPEDNMHRAKIERLYRTIETWVAEQNYGGDYQLDLVTVRMVTREKYAVVDLIENVFLE